VIEATSDKSVTHSPSKEMSITVAVWNPVLAKNENAAPPEASN